MSKTTASGILSYLAAARAEVKSAQDAVITGDLLQAAARVREANALQQEAVALLLAQCWQNTLSGARDEDPQRREEALDPLVRLATVILGALCQECRRQVSIQLQTDEKQ
ncbi:MAG: hypothetical protein ACOCXI_16720 [Chloroflexota bacterium]